MRRSSFLQTPPLSPPQLESMRLELEKTLNSDHSLNRKTLFFISFFEHLIAQKNHDMYRSYFLEFAGWVPELTGSMESRGWEPRVLVMFLDIVDVFENYSCRHSDIYSDARAKLSPAAIMANLYAGNLEGAAKIAGLDAVDMDKALEASPAQSALDNAVLFCHLLDQNEYPYRHEIRLALKKWQNLESYSPQSTPILLVEAVHGSENLDQNVGIVTSLSGAVRERPEDADRDLVSLNNRVHYDKNSIYWTLLDGVAAARSCQGHNNKMKRSLSFQFSIPEKNAVFSGNSIGAPAAILAYALIENRYYRTNYFHLAGQTALTGAIQPGGNILPVDANGLKSKLKSVFFSPINRVIVPAENQIEAARFVAKLKNDYPNRHLTIEGIDHLLQAVQNRNLTKIDHISTAKKTVGWIKRLPRHYLHSAATALFFIIMMLFILIFRSPHTGQPANFELVNGQLRIFDENSRFLWSYDLKAQFKTVVYENERFQPVVIRDIDFDQKTDVLFGVYDDKNALVSGRVWRFDHRGNVVWKRKMGKAVTFGGELFQDHFRVSNIFVRDLDRNGENEIIQFAYNYPDFPQVCQVTDINGNLLKEYWHAGHANIIAFKDINGDGSDEILMGGQNNEYHDAVLAVLDFHHLSGCSPPNPRIALLSRFITPGNGNVLPALSRHRLSAVRHQRSNLAY